MFTVCDIVTTPSTLCISYVFGTFHINFCPVVEPEVFS